MLTERVQAELSNEALSLIPDQDMWKAGVVYRLLQAEFEHEKDEWFWEDRWWFYEERDQDKPPLGNPTQVRKYKTSEWGNQFEFMQ